MKVATILPQNLLSHISEENYHMCLAHLLFKPGMEAYTEFYKAQCAKEGSYVIMDNGLIEGDPQPIEVLVEKALKVGAHELILPDVFFDAAETVKAVEGAVKYILDNNVRINLMVVPQGETLTEWSWCAQKLIDYNIECVGVPKSLTGLLGRDGRLMAMMQLMLDMPSASAYNFHLLGCYKSAIEIITIDSASRNKANKLPTIRGVDSALPYIYTRADLLINEADRPDSEPINFENGGEIDLRLLDFNIKHWVDAGGAGRHKTLTSVKGGRDEAMVDARVERAE